MSITKAMRTTTSVLALMLLGESAARGDGECAKGYRDTTAAERGTMTTVLEVAKKALPAAPQGWLIVGDESVSVPMSICGEYEAGPWRYSFTRNYQRVDDQEARNKIMEAAAADMKADMAKKQPRVDALTARMQELGKELGAAAQKRDYVRADEINKELEKISMEYKELLEEGDTTAKINAAGAEANRDLYMTISVAVNPKAESPGDGAENRQAPAGAQSAFRWSDDGSEVTQDHVLVLLGAWKPRAEGGSEPVLRGDAGAAAAQTMSVRIAADANRLATMVDSIDFKALETALAR